MNTKEIRELTTSLDDARKALATASDALSTARSVSPAGDQFGGGTQDTISAFVGNYRIDITTRNKSYRSTMIRGREMIHLGILKVLSANVDYLNERVRAIEQQIIDATGAPK